MMKAVSDLGPSLKSVAKMAILSRSASINKEKAHGTIIILANGPSLRQTIDENLHLLAASTTMAVNFAANAPDFWMLRPNYYIMVDPYFFERTDQERVKNLWAALAKADWGMTLIVPHSREKQARTLAPDLKVLTINPIGVEGWPWLEALAYKRAWGMPRPRNVLIAAIMAAIQMGYDDIVICGADHSWMQSIWVDDDNCVVTVQPHFYKEDAAHQAQVNSEYRGIPLHEVVHSFYVAFQAYHRIARYARRQGISITNATPGSYIDAFPRKPLLKALSPAEGSQP